MPPWLPDPLWPWLLGLTVALGTIGLVARVRPLMLCGGAISVGILLMQVPFAEPHRWLYAGNLWIVCAVILMCFKGCRLAGFILLAVALAYVILALERFFEVGASDLTINSLFGVTEIGVVLAIITTCKGLKDVVGGTNLSGRLSAAGPGRDHMRGLPAAENAREQS